MYSFEWINCRNQMPEPNTEILASDGYNCVVMEYKRGIFYPIRTVDVFSKLNIIPVYWYPLSEIQLPEA